MLRALLIPLAVVCVGLGVAIGGKVGQVLVIAGTVLAGAAAIDIIVVNS